MARCSQGLVPGDGPVCAVLAGGNIDATTLVSVTRFGLTSSGRYLVVAILISDRPGQLARIVAAVAEQRANVLSVTHHREGRNIGVLETEAELTLETRGEEHSQALVAALAAEACGFPMNGGSCGPRLRGDGDLSRMRQGGRGRRALLRGLREPARCSRRAARGAEGRDRRVRRPRRLDRARRAERSRGRPGDAGRRITLAFGWSWSASAARWRSSSATRLSPSSARRSPTRTIPSARCGRRSPSATRAVGGRRRAARRRQHGRGSRHARRPPGAGRGHGGRGRRQHRGPDPVGGAGQRRPRRRVDATVRPRT